jgi:acyl-lipid omega-6 desaturase (Delta-12 desaturase)
VHHLNARVPNYNLQRAHDDNPIFHDVPTLSLWDGLKAPRLKLFNQEAGKMVTFAQARLDTAGAETKRLRPDPAAAVGQPLN